MKRWIVPLASLSTVAGVVALTLFLAGVFDGSDASGTGDGGPESSALCAEGTPNCEDTLVTGDGNDDRGDTVAPGCEVGHVGDCNDTPTASDDDGDLIFEGDGPSIQPVCAPDFPDCVDTIVNSGETDDLNASDAPIISEPLCIEGVTDCADLIVNGSNGDLDVAEPPSDPIVQVTGECSGDAFDSCLRTAQIAVLTDAQSQFGVDDSEIVIEQSNYQEWSNACLDAASDGEACAEVITPGFVVVIDVAGTHYEYHTDLNGNARLAL
jgi:hypothetical protein